MLIKFYLYISDERFHQPFPLLDALKGQTLQPLLLAQNDVVRAHNKQVTLKLLIDSCCDDGLAVVFEVGHSLLIY